QAECFTTAFNSLLVFGDVLGSHISQKQYLHYTRCLEIKSSLGNARSSFVATVKQPRLQERHGNIICLHMKSLLLHRLTRTHSLTV
uniref:Uncharacterized protein n=1 Tax=Neolamprologus brichardi TaxID=32507 RepID=A0A3Q4HGC0_NEOBR